MDDKVAADMIERFKADRERLLDARFVLEYLSKVMIKEDLMRFIFKEVSDIKPKAKFANIFNIQPYPEDKLFFVTVDVLQ